MKTRRKPKDRRRGERTPAAYLRPHDPYTGEEVDYLRAVRTVESVYRCGGGRRVIRKRIGGD